MSKKTKFFKAFTLKHEGKKDWIRFMPTDKDDIIALRFTAIGGMIQEGLIPRERALAMMVDLYGAGWQDYVKDVAADERANQS